MDITAIDLNLLKAFEALLIEQSVTGAGRRVGLTQPAMSHALFRLRSIFRDELFIRTSEGMLPTARALALGVEVGAALHHVRAALNSLSVFDPSSSRRAFALGLTQYAELTLVPELTTAFADAAPFADLRLLYVDKSNLVQHLDEGRIHLAVGRFAHGLARHEQTFLCREPLIGLARAGHPKVPKSDTRMDLQTYASLQHLLVSPTGDPAGAVDKELAEMGVERRVALLVSSYLAVPLALVASDLLVAVPERAARKLAKLAGLIVFHLPFNHSFELTAIWHRRDAADAGYQWLRGLVQNAVNASRTTTRPTCRRSMRAASRDG